MTSSRSAESPARPLRWLARVGLVALALGQVAGVTATKSTVYFAQAEQALATARSVNAEKWAPYQWTRANETMKKSREEWAYSDFGAAEQLALEAMELAERATKRAQENKAKGVVPGQLRELPTRKSEEPAPAPAPLTQPGEVDASPQGPVDASPGATPAPATPPAEDSDVRDDSPKGPVDASPGSGTETDSSSSPWGG